MEGRRNPKGSVSPLYDRTTKGSISPLHYQAPKGSVSPLHTRSTPKRSVSPFNNRTPTSSVSSLNHHTPKCSPSPLPNQTSKGSISPLHSRAPKGSVSPINNQTSKRSVSPFLGQRPKGSISPLHNQTTTSSVSPLKTQIPKRWPSPLLSQTSIDSGSSLHNITPKRSASPLLGKTPKESVASLYSRTPKGSVSPLDEKTSKRSVSPLLSQTSKGSISPLHSRTPKRSVSPFQHKTPNRSVYTFQHQTPKGSVSPIHSQIPKCSVSPLLHQAPTLSDSSPLQVQEEIPTSLVTSLHDEGQTHEGSVSPLHDEQKTQEGMVSPLHNEEKTNDSTVSPLHDEEKTHEGMVSPLHDEGSVSLSHTQAKPSPNYLKASSGTCHDFCKYGVRNNFEEEKGKHGGLKSFKKGQNDGERRKKTIIKLRSLSSGRIVFSEKIEIRVEESLCSNEEGSDPAEWQDIKSYDDASIPSTEVQNEAEPTDSISDEDPDLVERKNKKQVLKSKESNRREAPEKKEHSSKLKMDTCKMPDRMKENTSLQERKAIAPAKPKLKEESDEHFRKPGKSKVIGRPTVESGAANDMHKPVSTRVENTPKKKSSIFTILRSGSGQRSHEGKSEKGVNRQKKGTNMPSTSSHSETKERVLHKIEPQPPKTTSKIRGSKFTEEQDTIKPEKSTFRRGKVVELPPDPGTPKKIKFRKGRRSNESVGGFQLGRRSFRRKGSISAGSSNPHSQVVVLRHRETEEKKGIQGLFNSIIEETVNKLVKTRKSKVKALVGAFETVISLQDGKSVPVE